MKKLFSYFRTGGDDALQLVRSGAQTRPPRRPRLQRLPRRPARPIENAWPAWRRISTTPTRPLALKAHKDKDGKIPDGFQSRHHGQLPVPAITPG